MATGKDFPVTTVGWFKEFEIDPPEEQLKTFEHMWEYIGMLQADPK